MELGFGAPTWRSAVAAGAERPRSMRAFHPSPPSVVWLSTSSLCSRTTTLTALYLREAAVIEGRIVALMKFLSENVAVDAAFSYIAGSGAEVITRRSLLEFLRSHKYFPGEKQVNRLLHLLGGCPDRGAIEKTEFMEAILLLASRAAGHTPPGSAPPPPSHAPFTNAFTAEPVIVHTLSQLILLDIRLDQHRCAVIEMHDFNLATLFRVLVSHGSHIVTLPDIKHFLSSNQSMPLVPDDIVRGMLCRHSAKGRPFWTQRELSAFVLGEPLARPGSFVATSMTEAEGKERAAAERSHAVSARLLPDGERVLIGYRGRHGTPSEGATRDHQPRVGRSTVTGGFAQGGHRNGRLATRSTSVRRPLDAGPDYVTALNSATR